VLKTLAIRAGNETYNESARFWTRIFGINFALGVVTGIPMEFQFGTNWAQFSRLTEASSASRCHGRHFFFFLESAFLGLFLYGEKRLGKWGTGGWLPVFLGHGSQVLYHRRRRMDAASSGLHAPVQWRVQCFQLLGLLTNPWALIQYAHNMSGAVVTGHSDGECGAFYLLQQSS